MRRPMSMDEHYPPTPRELRIFMAAYPAIIVGGYILGIAGSAWFWGPAAFCGVGWVATVLAHLGGDLRREGYRVALEDIEWQKIETQHLIAQSKALGNL